MKMKFNLLTDHHHLISQKPAQKQIWKTDWKKIYKPIWVPTEVPVSINSRSCLMIFTITMKLTRLLAGLERYSSASVEEDMETEMVN